MQEVERAKEILEGVINDPSSTRNIRAACEKALERLKNEKEKLHIRIGAAISFLDEISQDPNLPLHIRTKIWEAASLLETASTKIK